MSSPGAVAGGGPSAQRTEARYTESEEDRGFGWVVFAGVLIMMAGVLDIIYGIAAISESRFYVGNTHFVVSELKTWGWIVTCIGALQILVGAGIWARNAWARWTGVAIASLNGIAQLIFLPASPWLSLAVFALDVLVIYALVVYGGRLEEG